MKNIPGRGNSICEDSEVRMKIIHWEIEVAHSSDGENSKSWFLSHAFYKLPKPHDSTEMRTFTPVV